MTIEEERAGQHPIETQPGWTTTLKLSMPSLGGVEAVLQMQGDSLRLGLRADAGAAPTLRENGNRLAASLAEMGLKLVSIQVAQYGSDAA